MMGGSLGARSCPAHYGLWSSRHTRDTLGSSASIVSQNIREILSLMRSQIRLILPSYRKNISWSLAPPCWRYFDVRLTGLAESRQRVWYWVYYSPPCSLTLLTSQCCPGPSWYLHCIMNIDMISPLSPLSPTQRIQQVLHSALSRPPWSLIMQTPERTELDIILLVLPTTATTSPPLEMFLFLLLCLSSASVQLSVSQSVVRLVLSV